MWLAGTGSRVALFASSSSHSTSSMPCATVFARAAGLLDVEGVQRGPGRPRLFLLEQAADLVRLAAEADDQHRREVRVARVAAERAPQHLQRLAGAVGRAAGAVRQRDDAVDVREARERARVGVAAEVVGDRARDRRRAVHRGQDADVVARRDAAVGADDAVERRRRGDVLGRLRAARRRVVAREARRTRGCACGRAGRARSPASRCR